MKFLVLAVCILPVIMAAPEKRFLESLTGGNAFDLTVLKCDVQLMLDVLGTDPTELACEAECHKLLQEGHVFNYGCPLICHGFQSLASGFHLVEKPVDGSDPCAPSLVTTTATSV